MTPERAPGSQRLRQALRRLAHATHTRAAAPPPAPATPPPAAPAPESDWERAAEARLGRIERQLGSQNRLLLVTAVSIAADLLLGLAQ
jgi:hypothetical protein